MSCPTFSLTLATPFASGFCASDNGGGGGSSNRSGSSGSGVGPGTLTVTAGVVSQVCVMQYAHSGRRLLALRADVAAGRGACGAGAFDATGACMGVVLQRGGNRQSWAER